MPSFFLKKQTHYSLSPMQLRWGQGWGCGAGGLWPVRLLGNLQGSLLGSHWKVLLSWYLCCAFSLLSPPLPPPSFYLKQGWEAGGRAPALTHETESMCGVWWSKETGSLSTWWHCGASIQSRAPTRERDLYLIKPSQSAFCSMQANTIPNCYLEFHFTYSRLPYLSFSLLWTGDLPSIRTDSWSVLVWI